MTWSTHCFPIFFDHKLEVKYSVLEQNQQKTLHVQGTPEAILRLAKNTQKAHSQWNQFVQECPQDPDSYHRVIAYGRKLINSNHEELGGLVLDGLEDLAFYCFHDRLVPHVAQSIQAVRQKGIGFSSCSRAHSRTW